MNELLSPLEKQASKWIAKNDLDFVITYENQEMIERRIFLLISIFAAVKIKK